MTGFKTRLLKGLASAALLAAAGAAPAETILEIPDRGESGGLEYRMTFTVAEGDLQLLARTHKNACEALGAARCRVIEFGPHEGGRGSSGSARFVLAPGTTPAFMAGITRSTGKANFSIDNDGSQRSGRRNQAELEVEKQLLLAQRDRLAALKITQSPESLELIERKRSSIESQLSRTDEQMARLAKRAAVESLTIRYQDANRYGRPRSAYGDGLDLIESKFIFAMVVVTGIALLTVLYFGIIWLAFLGLRKFAINRGWLKGK
jgi:hypothetical protein